ncbi:MAG: MinD/ParA family protein [Pirellulales bacterium]|nr:MinD/ParA family protein [Pirellulales bacterium]
MSHVLRLAIVDPNDVTRESVKMTLLGLETVWLEAECSRYEFFPDVVNQTNPDIGFVALDSDPEKALNLVADLRTSAPDCGILVSSSSTDGSLILRAMRAGVREFLTYPLKPEDLVTALQRITHQRFGGPNASSKGCSVIAVTGATGGVGATSLAVNLACAFAANPTNSVVLVDIDLSLGDADVCLDSIPEYTIADVAQNVSRLDFTLLKRSLTKHTSGLYLLPRPVQLEDVRLITQDDLQRVIGLLKATFTHMVIDTSKSFSALDMLAMEMADHVLLVTQLDLPCLRNVVRLMMSFEGYGNLKEKVKVIVNRSGRDNSQISLKKAQETIGSEVFWQLPNDYRVMVEVRNNGVPLLKHAPKAPITQAIGQMADALAGSISGSGSGSTESDVKTSRRWLSLWPARGKS